MVNEFVRVVEVREQFCVVVYGWNFLLEFEEICFYFGLGWWIYSFCNNCEIVQYYVFFVLFLVDKFLKCDFCMVVFIFGCEFVIFV